MLGAAGACPEITCSGKTWKIGHPTQRAKAVLEELAVSKAIDEIIALERFVPADKYKKLFESLRDAITAGEYKTGGPGWARVALTGVNAHIFLLALLRECHPEATEQDARDLAIREPQRVQLALARVVPDFFELFLSGLPLPPEQRVKIQAALELVKQSLVQPQSPST